MQITPLFLCYTKSAPFIGPSISLLLNPSCICTKLPFSLVSAPFIEYCSHIWDGAPRSHGLDLLDQVKKPVVSFVGSGLSANLQALSHRSDVASLSLYYKYYYGKCSSELADLIPVTLVIVLMHSEQMHRHTVNSPLCRTKFYQSSFFPHAEALWNSLTNEFFPPDYELTAFKVRVNKFLVLK